jgi:uncharacterized protein DUF1553/uncharacterized protein DUF1549
MYNFHFLNKTVAEFILPVVFFMGCSVVIGAQDQTLRVFESSGEYKAVNEIDRIVAKTLCEKGITPAGRCSDQVFIRRVYLDVIGTLPEPQDVRKFLSNSHADKRALLIDSLLERKEFAEYWSLKWCDLLRVKAEFPINLWPNAVQAYHRWIHDAIAANMPYDKFARELLTSSGSNFRVPQVNFYRAIQGQEPSSIATAAALTFMGVRLDKLPKHRREGMQSLFSRVGYKKTAEWKEEIVFLDPAHTDSFNAVLPDGVSVQVSQGKDPRMVFADWLITPNNQWFTKNITNRIWAWLFGRGLIHEADDIRPDNPPVHPEVLEYLKKELIRKKYDLRHIYRLILNSSTYQQSSIPKSDNPKAEIMFACYPIRQLDAEVLIDALCKITGTKETYSSPIPEPFTFIPEEHRSIDLADGSITSQFLEMFGRPSRDTGLESERKNAPTDAQRLHMLNSTHIQNKIVKSRMWRRLPKAARGKKKSVINMLYLRILSRFPTEAEMEVAQKYYSAKDLNFTNATNDLIWVLINTKEFLYRH